MLPAIFLDRDGVIVENRPNYIRSWDDIEIFPQALRALSLIRNASIKIIIVTNQSAIGKGLLSKKQSDAINDQLLTEIRIAGGHIDGVYVCPHNQEDDCNCRKPRPGLLLKAAKEHSIDLDRSIMIGDAFSDIQAGRNAGLSILALVLTGRGKEQLKNANTNDLKGVTIFDNLEKALINLINF